MPRDIVVKLQHAKLKKEDLKGKKQKKEANHLQRYNLVVSQHLCTATKPKN